MPQNQDKPWLQFLKKPWEKKKKKNNCHVESS